MIEAKVDSPMGVITVKVSSEEALKMLPPGFLDNPAQPQSREKGELGTPRVDKNSRQQQKL